MSWVEGTYHRPGDYAGIKSVVFWLKLYLSARASRRMCISSVVAFTPVCCRRLSLAMFWYTVNGDLLDLHYSVLIRSDQFRSDVRR